MTKKCADWLQEYLQDGMCLCEDVREAERKQGFTKKELQRARDEIGVKTFHQWDELGQTPNWFWYLEVQR